MALADDERLTDERSEIADRLSGAARSWSRPDALDCRVPSEELSLLLEALNELNARRLRIAKLEAALRPFADIAGVAVQRMKIPEHEDRLWSYHDSRADKDYAITRAHINEAARVLKST